MPGTANHGTARTGPGEIPGNSRPSIDMIGAGNRPGLAVIDIDIDIYLGAMRNKVTPARRPEPASPHLVSKFTSILKISRLFLYCFQKGDLYIQNYILSMGFATFCAFLKKAGKNYRRSSIGGGQ